MQGATHVPRVVCTHTNAARYKNNACLCGRNNAHRARHRVDEQEVVPLRRADMGGDGGKDCFPCYNARVIALLQWNQLLNPIKTKYHFLTDRTLFVPD